MMLTLSGFKAITRSISFFAFAWLLCFRAAPLFAENIDLFSSANTEYKAGRYQEAIHVYEQLIETGHLFAAVYYNLGNAYAKTGDLGKAILNFERARRLQPRDPEIVNNLSYVKSLLERRVEDKRSPVLLGLDKIFGKTSAAETVFIGLLSYAFWILSYLVYILFRRPRWMKRIVSILFLVAACTAVLAGLKHFMLREEDAFVITNTAEVKYGPSDEDKTAFKLSAGLPVFVNEERDLWSRIELRDGTGGWISNKSIERIQRQLA